MTKLDLKRLAATLLAATGVPVTLAAAEGPGGSVVVRGRFASPVEFTTTHAPDADGLVRVPLDGGGTLTLHPLPEG